MAVPVEELGVKTPEYDAKLAGPYQNTLINWLIWWKKTYDVAFMDYDSIQERLKLTHTHGLLLLEFLQTSRLGTKLLQDHSAIDKITDRDEKHRFQRAIVDEMMFPERRLGPHAQQVLHFNQMIERYEHPTPWITVKELPDSKTLTRQGNFLWSPAVSVTMAALSDQKNPVDARKIAEKTIVRIQQVTRETVMRVVDKEETNSPFTPEMAQLFDQAARTASLEIASQGFASRVPINSIALPHFTTMGGRDGQKLNFELLTRPTPEPLPQPTYLPVKRFQR